MSENEKANENISTNNPEDKDNVQKNNKEESIPGKDNNTLVVDLENDEDTDEPVSESISENVLVIEVSDENDKSKKPVDNILTLSLDDLDAETMVHSGFTSNAETYQGIKGDLYSDIQKKKGYSDVVSKRAIIELALAGLIGGILAWLITEPLSRGEIYNQDIQTLVWNAALYTAIVGATIGASLGLAYGLTAGGTTKIIRNVITGLLFGIIGGICGGSLAQYIYGSILLNYQFGIIGQTMLRAVGWSILGVFIGIGQSSLIPADKKMRNSITGGALGGLIGGGAFQLISYFSEEASLGRALALAVMGLSVGLLVSLVEETSKEAWLQIKTGPLAGKQFIIYEERTVIGSSPSCDIVMFKDNHVLPEHALITWQSQEYILKTFQGSSVRINGKTSSSQALEDGYTIEIGETHMVFHQRKVKK